MPWAFSSDFAPFHASDFRRSIEVMTASGGRESPAGGSVPIGTELTGVEEEEEEPSPWSSPCRRVGERLDVSPWSSPCRRVGEEKLCGAVSDLASPNRVEAPAMVRTYSSFTMRLEYHNGPGWEGTKVT